jgi:hypothetical protein
MSRKNNEFRLRIDCLRIVQDPGQIPRLCTAFELKTSSLVEHSISALIRCAISNDNRIVRLGTMQIDHARYCTRVRPT